MLTRRSEYWEHLRDAFWTSTPPFGKLNTTNRELINSPAVHRLLVKLYK
jgi:hypothetical protein